MSLVQTGCIKSHCGLSRWPNGSLIMCVKNRCPSPAVSFPRSLTMKASIRTVNRIISTDMQAVSHPRRKWVLKPEAFDRLLDSLGEDRESAGKRYLEIRSNLVRFFEWRGSPVPEDHADETINRVAKRISER